MNKHFMTMLGAFEIMNNTVDFWKGDFGDSYTARNRYDWRKRIQFWNAIIEKTGARSVYEVGCNVGYNLSAIKHENDHVVVYGEDVNMAALSQADSAGLPVSLSDSDEEIHLAPYELVFTVGVLSGIPLIFITSPVVDVNVFTISFPVVLASVIFTESPVSPAFSLTLIV